MMHVGLGREAYHHPRLAAAPLRAPKSSSPNGAVFVSTRCVAIQPRAGADTLEWGTHRPPCGKTEL